jgi:hypothetical protein
MSTNATKKGQYMPAHPCRQSRIIRMFEYLSERGKSFGRY